MHQNVTDLSPEQAQALDLLMAGQNPCNIAKTLGIHRQTLWRWRQLPAFQVAHQELMQRQRDELHDRMAEVLRLSLAAVERALQHAEDDRRIVPIETALSVLKLTRPASMNMLVCENRVSHVPATLDNLGIANDST
jgi:hypothetical protein